MMEPHVISDRMEIQALREEFTDACMTNDHERLGSLFTSDGALRIPGAGIEMVGPDQVRTLGERREAMAACFVQNMHPGRIEIEADAASGRTYMFELFQLRDGTSHTNYAIYHDRYARTEDGWKFAERVYEIRYLDTSPLAGRTPDAAAVADLAAGRPPTPTNRSSL